MPTEAEELQELVELEALRQGVNPAFAVRTARTESGLNPHAIGSSGERGVMQLMEGTARDLKVDRTNPAQNIEGGVRYLKQQVDTFGDERRAAAAYNRGPGAVKRYGGVPPGAEPYVRATAGGGDMPQAKMSETERAERQELAELEALMRGETVTGMSPGPGQAPQERPFAREIAEAEAEVERTQVASPDEAAARVREYAEIFTPYGEVRTAANPLPPAPVSDAAAVPYRAPTWGEVGQTLTTGRRPVPQILIEKGTDPTLEPPLRQQPYEGPPVYGMTDTEKQVYDQRVKDAAKDVAATGIDVIGGTGGAAIGGLLTLNPLGAIGGSVVGSGAANELNIALGLRERSLLGEVLTYGPPILPAVRPAARAIRRTLGPAARAQRAVTAAEEATRLGRQAYDIAEADRLLRYQDRRAVAEQRLDDAHRAAMAKWEREGIAADEAEKARFARETATHQDKLAKADEAERAAMQKYTDLQMARRDAIRAGQDASDEVLERVTQAEMDYRDALKTFREAEQAQADALKTVRDIPGRYLPQMPADVPPPRGERPTPRPELVDEYYNADGSLKVPLNSAPMRELELQDVLRQVDERGQFGVKLKDEELFEELDSLLGKAESGAGKPGSGRQILKNDKSGLTSDAWAQKLHEEGFIDSPDVDSFIRALDDSVRGGRPVYSKFKTPPEVVQGRGPVVREVADDAAVSARLYQRLDEYGDAPVYSDTVRDQIDDLLTEVEPLTNISPSAGRVKAILNTLKGLDSTDVKTVHNLLKKLRPLTASGSGEVRYVAHAAMDILSDAVEQTARIGVPETAAAGKLMAQARKAFRQEKAVETLRRKLRDGGGIVSKDANNNTAVNIKAVMNLVDNLVATDRYFARSFTPAELAQMRKDFAELAGTPAMPKTRPTRPGPEDIKAARQVRIPDEPERPSFAPRPEPPRPYQKPAQGPAPQRKPLRMAPYRARPAPAPVEATLKPPGLKRLASESGPGVALASIGLLPGWAGAVGVGVAAGDYISYALAKRLLTPEGRQKLARIMTKEGTITARQAQALLAGIQIPKATLQREASERQQTERRRRDERTRRRAEEREQERSAYEEERQRRGF
jgi:hypothetical protein